VSQEPTRDRAIDALLREQLRAGAAAGPSDRCVDAETLAAWIDGDLKAADIATAEAHVSTCARCQTMIAALVRATPAVPRTVPWWRRGWVVGSLVPLTAGAIAIAIWVATPNVTQYPASARADVPAPPPVEVFTSRAEPPAPTSSVAASPQVPPSPQKPSAILDRTSTPAASEPPATAENRARDADERKEIAAPRYDRPTAAPAAPATPMAARAAAPAAPVAGSSPPPRTAAASAPSAAPAPPPVAAPDAARQAFGARGDIVANQVVAKHAVVQVEVRSPNPSIRWRVGAAGSIERSGNGGATWSASSSGVTEDLTAGAAPSPIVCWIVGRRGTVLLSIDGLQWRRVAFPDNADLAAVQASDASSATVTTSDSRRFRTSDGGQTWTLLQEF
jgi:hypothetical protein